MKRLLPLVAIGLILAFYAWPGWSAYQIKEAIKAKDAATLERKIDFPSVRISLRPAATQKISELYDRYQSQANSTAALIAGRMKQEAMPRIVDAALAAVVTPDNLIRVAAEGGQLKDMVDRMLGDEFIRVGGAGTSRAGGGTGSAGAGKQSSVVRTVTSGGQAAGPAPAYSLDNVKRFSILGPFRFEIGVAKDAAAAEPDVTAEMSFSGLDWKVTAVKPRT